MTKMRTAATAVIAIVTVAATTPVLAHEMFLKAAESVVAPNSDTFVRLINGTFVQSENSISRDRKRPCRDPMRVTLVALPGLLLRDVVEHDQVVRRVGREAADTYPDVLLVSASRSTC